MSDEVRPRQTQKSPNDPKEGSPDGSIMGPPDATDHVPERPAQGNLSIFDERFALFMGQFSETCESQGIELAIAIVADPKIPDRPLVFYNGGIYDVACLTREVFEHLRNKVLQSLS